MTVAELAPLSGAGILFETTDHDCTPVSSGGVVSVYFDREAGDLGEGGRPGESRSRKPVSRWSGSRSRKGQPRADVRMTKERCETRRAGTFSPWKGRRPLIVFRPRRGRRTVDNRRFLCSSSVATLSTNKRQTTAPYVIGAVLSVVCCPSLDHSFSYGLGSFLPRGTSPSFRSMVLTGWIVPELVSLKRAPELPDSTDVAERLFQAAWTPDEGLRSPDP